MTIVGSIGRGCGDEASGCKGMSRRARTSKRSNVETLSSFGVEFVSHCMIGMWFSQYCFAFL